MDRAAPLSTQETLRRLKRSSDGKAAHCADTAISRSPSPSPQARLPTGALSSFSLPKRNPNEASHQATNAALRIRRRAHYLKNWWLGIGACFLFISAMIAIVVTLLPHQGKPSPQWPYHISVNSLISIYVVILKATVLLVTAEGLGE